MAIVLVVGLLVAALGPAPGAQATIDPGSIAGTVTDLADQPLSGITVSVLRLDVEGPKVVGQDETDASGDYQIDDIGASPYLTVRFTDPSGGYATEYFDDTVGISFAVRVPITAHSITTGVDASLEPAASISGRLTTITGAPIANGQVRLTWNPPGYFIPLETYPTDVNGYYTIGRVPAATYYLDFYDPASGNREFWNDQPGQTSYGMYVPIAGVTPLVVASGASMTNINAVLGGLVKNIAAPSISGIARVGQPLTASPGTWTPAATTVTYRWVVGTDTTSSDDPTGTVYVPTPADLGKTIRVEATGTYAGWEVGSAWSSPTAPVKAPPAVTSVVRPRVKGTLEVGQVVRVSHGVWKPASVACKYQWYVGGKAIPNATRRHLTLTAKYVGKRLTVRVKAKAEGYSPAIVWSKPTARIKA